MALATSAARNSDYKVAYPISPDTSFGHWVRHGSTSNCAVKTAIPAIIPASQRHPAAHVQQFARIESRRLCSNSQNSFIGQVYFVELPRWPTALLDSPFAKSSSGIGVPGRR